jgi:hypothetical protein
MTGPTPVFDRVIIQLGVERRELSIEEFLHLPLHERVRYVLDRSVEFCLGSTVVDRKLALNSLRALTG